MVTLTVHFTDTESVRTIQTSSQFHRLHNIILNMINDLTEHLNQIRFQISHAKNMLH